MVAYSFKKRFAEPIAMGWKRQTIRGPRKRHARPGEELQLYTGMRTRHCRLILRTTCVSVQRIDISLMWAGHRPFIPEIRIDGAVVADDGAFAIADGFASLDDMAEFWWVEHLVDDERDQLKSDVWLSCTFEDGRLIKW